MIVVNLPAPGDLAVGDYVFASRWSDCDWCDPWMVGFVSEVGKGFVFVRDSARCWCKAMRISQEQGRRIVAEYPTLESERVPLDYAVVARVFE